MTSSKEVYVFDKRTIGGIMDGAIDAFNKVRVGFWQRIGDTPIQTAVRLMLKYNCEKSKLKVSDIGCGLGGDLILLPDRLKDSSLFGDKAFSGEVECVGCDVSSEMVAYAKKEGLMGVEQGDFRELANHLKGANLVWANLSLIHFPIAEFQGALKATVSLGASGAIIAIGLKTGDDETRIERKGNRISGQRVTTYLRSSTLKKWLLSSGCELLASIDIPAESADDTNGYAWVFARKVSRNLDI